MQGRRADRRLQTYTRQHISAWNEELARNPDAIVRHQQEIHEHRAQLDKLEPQLRALVANQINPQDGRIAGLDAQIRFLTIPGQIQNLEQQLLPHQHALQDLQMQLNAVNQVIGPIDAEISRLNIFIEIRDLQLKITEHEREIAANNESIGCHQHELRRLVSEHDEIESHLRSAQSQLSVLRMQQSYDSTAHMVHAFDHHHYGHHGHHGGYGAVLHYTNDLAVNAGIGALQVKVDEYERHKHEVHDRIRALEAKIAAHVNESNTLARRNSEFASRISMLQGQVPGLQFSDNVVLLRSMLAQKNAEKLPHDQARNNFLREIEKHNRDIAHLRQQIQALHNDFETAQRLRMEYAVNENLADLQIQLQASRQVREQMENEKRQLDQSIASHTQAITAAGQSIAAIEARQQSLNGNQYLIVLRDQPETLINQLAALVRERFAAYEDAHPANQDEHVRLCLAETELRLQFILALPSASLEETRNKYYQLCGMLWEMLDRVDGNADMEFLEMLMAILRSHPLDPTETKFEWLRLRRAWPDNIRDLTFADLSQLQYLDYDQAYQTLRNMLDCIPDKGVKAWNDLRVAGMGVLYSIDEQKVKAVKHADPRFDIKYHTTVLKKTAQVVSDPGNPQLRQQYHRLTGHNKDGKPSLAKKIIGAVCMFLGAAAAVASGVMMAVKSVNPFTISGAAGGGTLFAFGAGLFGWGMRKGSNRKMANFEKAAERASASPVWPTPAVTTPVWTAAPPVPSAGKKQLRSSAIDDDTTEIRPLKTSFQPG